MRDRSVTLSILAGLFMLPLILFWPVTLGGQTLLPADVPFQFEPWQSNAEQFGVEVPDNQLLADLILENYPWKQFILQSMRAGEVPLWNPYLFGGAPFMANGQSSTFYPFSAIFYVMPLAQAYGWFTVSQLFLAGAFMYCLGRVLGISKLGSAFAAVTYQLSGFFVVSVVFTMIIAAAAWLPLLLAMIECVIQQRSFMGRPATLPWVIVGAFGLGCMILAGHPEIVYYSLLLMAFFAIWRLASQRVNESAGQRIKDWLHAIRRPFVWLVVMVVLGIGLGAIQLLPLGEVVTQNFRDDSATFEQVQGWALPARHVLAMLMPNVFGNPAHHTVYDFFNGQEVAMTTNLHGEVNPNGAYSTHWGIKNYVEGGMYLGILPLLLAALAVITYIRRRTNNEAQTAVVGRRSFISCFSALALLSLAFAFGTPLYALLFYGLPGINQLHSPFRWIWPFTLSIAILAGFGIDALRRHTNRLQRFLSALAMWGGLSIIAALLLSRFVFPMQSLAIADRLLRSLALADTAFPNAEVFYSYEWNNVLLFAVFLATSGFVLTASSRSWRVRGVAIWKPLALGVTAIDLLIAATGFNPAVDQKLLDYIPPVVSFLKQDTSLWRFTTFDPQGRKTFNSNVGWPYGFQDVRGYDSIILKQYAQYMEVIDTQDEFEYNRVAPLRSYGGLDSPMLDLLGVKYVLTDPDVPIESPKYQLVYDAEVKVYENQGVVPRAFTMSLECTIATDDPLNALRSYDPRQNVIVEDTSSAIAEPTPCDGPRPASITQYGSNEVFVEANIDQPAWLILTDTYFNGWQAFDAKLDGSESEVPIVRAYGNFRAVKLDAGPHRIRFNYSPWSFKLGAFITFMSGVVIVFLLGMWLWRFAYREEEHAGTTVRRVAKNSIAPMALNLFNRGIDFAFAALMLRILQPENAGNYYFAIVIVGWFEILSNFGLNTLLTREVAKDRAQANRYLSNTSILRLILAAFSTPLVLLVIVLYSAGGTFTAETALAIVLLAIAQLPSSLSNGLTAMFYAYEKAEYPAVIAVVTGLMKVALGTPVLLLGWGIVGLAAVSVVVNVFTLIVLSRLSFRMFFRPRYESDPTLRREMVRESFPLMINHLLATLFFKIDVPLMQSLKGPVVVGLYSAAYKWVDALNIIPAFSTIAVFPVMSRQAQEDRPALLRSYKIGVRLLVMLALPIAVMTVFLAPTLMLILGGEEYLPHSAIALQIMILSIPFGWINSITNYLLISAGQQSKLTRAFVIGLSFNLIANLILIPYFSYVAAAATTILSELIEGFAFYYYVEKYIGPVLWVRLLWKLFVSAGLMFGVMAFLWPINALLGLVAGPIVYAMGVWGSRALGPEERAVFAKLRGRQAAQPIEQVEAVS